MAKAEIYRKDDKSQSIVCQFNPETLSTSRSIDWKCKTTMGKDADELEFAGGKSQDLKVDLWFDSTDDGTDVQRRYAKLLEMATVDRRKRNPSTGKGEPPECVFQWGAYLSFAGVITNIAQKFMLFGPDGTPLRANVTVTFCESASRTKGQNPTTRTTAYKVHQVTQGERLDWIAYIEYGDASQWRHIAETNNVDNPQDLHPGQILRLFPVS